MARALLLISLAVLALAAPARAAELGAADDAYLNHWDFASLASMKAHGVGHVRLMVYKGDDDSSQLQAAKTAQAMGLGVYVVLTTARDVVPDDSFPAWAAAKAQEYAPYADRFSILNEPDLWIPPPSQCDLSRQSVPAAGTATAGTSPATAPSAPSAPSAPTSPTPETPPSTATAAQSSAPAAPAPAAAPAVQSVTPEQGAAATGSKKARHRHAKRSRTGFGRWSPRGIMRPHHWRDRVRQSQDGNVARAAAARTSAAYRAAADAAYRAATAHRRAFRRAAAAREAADCRWIGRAQIAMQVWRATIPLLRAAAPGATILIGETSPLPGCLDFAREAVRLGLPAADGWAHHPYPGLLPSRTRSATCRLETAEQIGSIVGMPMYWTEFGVKVRGANAWTNVDNAKQVWSQAMAKADALGVREVVAYGWRASPDGAWDTAAEGILY